jgi:monooxygenase
LTDKIELSTQVTAISWSSQEAKWTIHCTRTCNRDDTPSQETIIYQCRFICLCTGYYDYSQGYLPSFPGSDRFNGNIIHPQFWPSSYDETDKKIVIIGSGATAITLAPVLAKKASNVVMLQRSPTYILPLPDVDHLSNLIMAVFPSSIGHTINRWKSIALMNGMYLLCRFFPSVMKTLLLGRSLPCSLSVSVSLSLSLSLSPSSLD